MLESQGRTQAAAAVTPRAAAFDPEAETRALTSASDPKVQEILAELKKFGLGLDSLPENAVIRNGPGQTAVDLVALSALLEQARAKGR